MMPAKIKTIWDKFVHGSLRYTSEQTHLLNLSVANAEYAQGLAFEQQQHTHNALWFYLRAASHGDCDAQFKLGISYLKGELNVQQDLQEAKKWLMLAAEQGHQEARLLLSNFVSSLQYS